MIDPSPTPPVNRCGALMMLNQSMIWLAAATLGLFAICVLCAYVGWFRPALGIGFVCLVFLSTTNAAILFGFSCCNRNSHIASIIRIVLAIAGALTVTMRWHNPSENYWGGNDEGVYTAVGINIAGKGSAILKPELLPAVYASLKPWAIEMQPAMADRSGVPLAPAPHYHASILVLDKEGAKLGMQFPPGFSTILAASYSCFDYNGIRHANFILALTSALIAGLLMGRWLGPSAGCGVFLAFLLMPLQIWLANSNYAEPALQWLWLLHVLAWSESKSNPESTGLLAGLTAGLSPLIKIDGCGIVAVFFISLFCIFRTEKRKAAFAIAAFTSSALLTTWVTYNYNKAYWLNTIASLTSTNTTALAFAVAIAAAMLVFVIVYKGRVQTSRHKWMPWLLAIISAAVVLGAAYAWFIRPNPTNPDHFYFWPAGRELRSYREETFLRLSWYFTPFGLLIAIAGTVALLWRAKELWHWIFLGFGLLCLVAFSYDLRHIPVQPAGMRRLMPFAYPVLLIAAGTFGSLLANLSARFRYLFLAISIGILAGFWSINDRLNRQPDKRLIRQQISAFASQLPRNTILLARFGTVLSRRLPTPLEFIYGIPCLRIDPSAWEHNEASILRKEVGLWIKTGRRVYILSDKKDETIGLDGLYVARRINGRMQTTEVPRSSEELLTQQKPTYLDWILYEITDSQPTRKPQF